MLEQIQKFSDSDVFSLTLESEPEKTRYWFRATEICDLLFTKGNTQRYVTLHCKDWQYREFQVGKGRPALYVCESGVYRLILRSKSQFALEFQDWLTEEVLPKLRASGGYIMPTATSEQVQALVEEHQKRIDGYTKSIVTGRFFYEYSIKQLRSKVNIHYVKSNDLWKLILKHRKAIDSECFKVGGLPLKFIYSHSNADPSYPELSYRETNSFLGWQWYIILKILERTEKLDIEDGNSGYWNSLRFRPLTLSS